MYNKLYFHKSALDSSPFSIFRVNAQSQPYRDLISRANEENLLGNVLRTIERDNLLADLVLVSYDRDVKVVGNEWADLQPYRRKINQKGKYLNPRMISNLGKLKLDIGVDAVSDGGDYRLSDNFRKNLNIGLLRKILELDCVAKIEARLV